MFFVKFYRIFSWKCINHTYTLNTLFFCLQPLKTQDLTFIVSFRFQNTCHTFLLPLKRLIMLRGIFFVCFFRSKCIIIGVFCTSSSVRTLTSKNMSCTLFVAFFSLNMFLLKFRGFLTRILMNHTYLLEVPTLNTPNTP